MSRDGCQSRLKVSNFLQNILWNRSRKTECVCVSEYERLRPKSSETGTDIRIIDWESVEAHTKFNTDQNTLLKFVKLFEPTAKDGNPQGKFIHASWEEDEGLECLKAPFIELRKISPKRGVEVQAIRGALDKYVAEVTSKAARATYGHVIEEPEKLIVVVGSEVACVRCIASCKN